MSTLSPPSYSQAETPSYTAHPRGGEQTLGLTSRARRIADGSHLSNWTKKVGHATLTLTGQSLDTQLPVYGRGSTIKGFVTLDSVEDVANVQLKLEGHAKCKTIAEIGRSDVTVLSLVKSLWTRNDSSSSCPTKLPFEAPLSTMYTWGEQSGPLPPSFEYTFYDLQGGTPGLMAKIKYEISVEVESSHLSLKDRLMATPSTQFIYLPRSRPGRPRSDSPTSVFEAVMEHRLGGKRREVDPIVWKLRLHPPGTYAITQPIPFHVTVTSRSSALLTPFAPTNKEKASIRVYILRQVSIKVNTIDLWRSYVIAEGSLTYIPQDQDDEMWLKNIPSSAKGEKAASLRSGESVGSSSEREGWASHEWSGELKIDNGQTAVGGFAVGDMIVKDFIVLSVVPPNPRLGDLLEVKRVVPIQLTTDSHETSSYSPPTVPPIDGHTGSNPETNGYLEGRGEGHHVESGHQNGTNGHREYHNGADTHHA